MRVLFTSAHLETTPRQRSGPQLLAEPRTGESPTPYDFPPCFTAFSTFLSTHSNSLPIELP